MEILSFIMFTYVIVAICFSPFSNAMGALLDSLCDITTTHVYSTN
jgi:hypothetical protein